VCVLQNQSVDLLDLIM